MTQKTTKRNNLILPTVEECIAYIESTDYKLTRRGRGWYIFESSTRPPHCRELTFSLAELRDAWKNEF